MAELPLVDCQYQHAVFIWGDSPHFHIIMHMHDISGIGLECSEIANLEMGGWEGGTFTLHIEDISLVTRKCGWKIGKNKL